jgi:hypothetical protein
MFVFRDIDLSELASETNMAPSVEEDHPIHLFEVQEDGSLEMVRFWLEEDAQDDTPIDGLTWMRPAKILEEETRYIVAIEDIVQTDGDAIGADADFAALRDGTAASRESVADRQEHFNEIFTILEDEAGINREDLTLAWDFNTASSDTLHGSMLEMRDKALDAVGDTGPSMTFTAVGEEDGSQEYNCTEGEPGYNSGIAYLLRGTFDTPYYMRPVDESATDPLALPSVFNMNEQGEIEQNGTRDAPFWIMVPCSAVGTEAEPAGMIQYGHGLLGTGGQTDGGFNKRIAREYNYIFFGGNWTGMASPDLATVVSVVSDVGKFAQLVDRMHQGIIEFITLGRAMKNTFPTATEVTSRDIQIDPDTYYYSGISQGGIYGGTLMAVSPDLRYGHLGVPGQNYSILLHRSVDFDAYFGILRTSLPEPIDQGIALALIQQLWDQVDPSSYYKHMSKDPFPGNDPSYVMLAPAKGDYQVSTLTNLIAANSDSEVAVMENYAPGDRDISHIGVTEQSYGTEEEPYVGSAVISWDLGNPWPEPGNEPPDDSAFCWEQRGMPASDDCASAEDCRECDPHGIPRYFPSHQEQMMHFFENEGEVIDVCGGNGCRFETTDCWDDDCDWTEF